MKNKLVSIIAASLMVTGLVGCMGIPLIKEEKPLPKIEKKYIPQKKIEDKRIMLAQSSYSSYCNCGLISEGINKTEKYLNFLEKAKNYSIKELQKNPKNKLYERDLYEILDLRGRFIQIIEDLFEESKRCECNGKSM